MNVEVKKMADVYPKDFVKRVKEATPGNDHLHDLLNKNRAVAGVVLEDLSAGFSAEYVLKMLQESPEQLKEIAEQRALIGTLYHEWREITKDWR